jgi:hypothetical protein
MAKSLFEYAERAGFNKYEAEVALVLDKHPEALWWYWKDEPNKLPNINLP